MDTPPKASPAGSPNGADKPLVPVLICAMLALVTLAVYWPVTRCEFVSFDDPYYVTQNAQVQAGLTWENLRWALTAKPVGNWHPLTWISHMVDCELCGLDPAGHHFTNLLLHVANSILLFLLLRRMTGAVWRSALVAALFAWHPLRVESVAWVSERKDVLSTLFWVLTIWAYGRYTEFKIQDSKSSIEARTWYRMTLVFFALGLLAKPMLVTLPFLLLLLDFWPLRRTPAILRVFGRDIDIAGASAEKTGCGTPFKQLILEKLPLLALSVVSCAITLWAQSFAVGSLGHSIWHRLGNAILAYFGYLEKLFWPVDLVVVYPYPSVLAIGRLAVAILVVGGLTWLSLRCARTRRYLFTGWFWFLGTLVPVIGLVQVGDQGMADRYTYVPLIGVSIMLVWGVFDLVKSRRPAIIALGSLAVLALATCLPLTRAQLRPWQNSVALFQHALRLTTNNYPAEFNLGIVYFERRQWDAARQHFSAAANIYPKHPEARHALALTLIEQGVVGDAIDQLTIALQLATNHWEGHYRLGLVLANQGKVQEALGHFASAVRINPTNAPARHNLATALRNTGQPREAIVQYREAVKLDPQFPEPLNALAWILSTHPDPQIRNGMEAVPLAERACQLTRYQAPLMLMTLGAAYAEAGRFEEAAATVKMAEPQATAGGNEELAEKCRKMTELFASRQPYHEPAVIAAPAQKQP
jgi:protein O-mannosyl-transferase